MTVSAPIRLDRARQAAPQVYEKLRERIVSLLLPPGTPLSRTELAAQFGVSQTPVRDALMRLEEEDLVEVFPQAGTVVSKIDLLKARQAHFLRLAIELELVRTLLTRPGRKDTLVASLRGIVGQQRVFSEMRNFRQFQEADYSFHRHFYEASGMQDLWLLVQSRSGHIDRLRQLHLPASGKAQAVLRDHESIIAAMSRNDADAAQQALRQHLSGTLAQADEIKARYLDYFRS